MKKLTLAKLLLADSSYIYPKPQNRACINKLWQNPTVNKNKYLKDAGELLKAWARK